MPLCNAIGCWPAGRPAVAAAAPRGAQFERGFDRAPAVVFARARVAEDRHHAVALRAQHVPPWSRHHRAPADACRSAGRHTTRPPDAEAARGGAAQVGNTAPPNTSGGCRAPDSFRVSSGGFIGGGARSPAGSGCGECSERGVAWRHAVPRGVRGWGRGWRRAPRPCNACARATRWPARRAPSGRSPATRCTPR